MARSRRRGKPGDGSRSPRGGADRRPDRMLRRRSPTPASWRHSSRRRRSSAGPTVSPVRRPCRSRRSRLIGDRSGASGRGGVAGPAGRARSAAREVGAMGGGPARLPVADRQRVGGMRAGVLRLGRVRRDDRPEPHPADEVAVGGELLVRRRDRQAPDAELSGEGPDAREPLTRPQATAIDRPPNERLDLAVERLLARRGRAGSASCLPSSQVHMPCRGRRGSPAPRRDARGWNRRSLLPSLRALPDGIGPLRRAIARWTETW